LQSLIEKWSKLRITVGLLKAFETVEIVGVLSDLFFLAVTVSFISAEDAYWCRL